MQVQETFEDFAEASYHVYEIAPRLDPQGLREAYFDGNLFEVGCFIENVNTGLLVKLLVVAAIMSSILMSMIMYIAHG